MRGIVIEVNQRRQYIILFTLKYCGFLNSW